MPTRRALLSTAAFGAVAGLLARPVAAQSFPSRPLRIVVPNAAGGAADLTARTVAQRIAGPLGQNVVVDNKPGAGGVVAGELVARAEPDGHTLLLISSGTAVSAALFRSLPFDAQVDFAPVSLLATFDLVLVVPEGSRFRTLADLLTWARAHPGRLNIGTPNIGTTQHLAAELFKLGAGIDAQVIPFNGTPPVINALRGGQVEAGVDILGPLMGQIGHRGALRPLAVLGAARAPQLADVPTVRESGGPALAQFGVASWNGLAVPVKTPAPVIARLGAELRAALALPDVVQRFSELNLTAQASTPVQLADRLAADIRRWTDVIAQARIPRQ